MTGEEWLTGEEWTEQDKERLLQEIEKAHREWRLAQDLLNQMDIPDLIDYSIYNLKAAEAKYMYLYKLGKSIGIYVDPFLPQSPQGEKSMEGHVWVALAVAAVAVSWFVPVVRTGLWWLVRGGAQVALGALLVFLCNVVGSWFAVQLPINWFTAAVAGFLGLPGLGALLVIQWLVTG